LFLHIYAVRKAPELCARTRGPGHASSCIDQRAHRRLPMSTAGVRARALMRPESVGTRKAGQQYYEGQADGALASAKQDLARVGREARTSMEERTSRNEPERLSGGDDRELARWPLRERHRLHECRRRPVRVWQLRTHLQSAANGSRLGVGRSVGQSGC
jgi:hypothetical protein